ncbi:MAG: hypothetical protein JJ926_17480 [Roseitalea sp.]|jgi:hypothetical protein|uniref:Excinuclease ABC subunit A n=1 Tax=Oceaniradius stylonematis TaxID=2184161 RepID=A0A3A8A9L3_9HYPH|nr:hypothetical protein [Oceaniradius stylonematis]MBO6554509.1 hypothetical protein [Roseitalea sp.]MBO6953552.1 hypothetical protein [Rhizobiaceae bacterium]RNC93470.1 MAG: hypothetical protein ED558_11180 [Oricola sp.]MBO6594019.1 hypothetical protein [Roseitalea sp.]MBO6601296.1 hypothetical protein [Roseitalea sp.]
MTVHTGILKAGAVILMAFGVLFTMAAWPPLAGLIRFLVDLFAWPLDGAQTLAASETRLALAIGGGVMAGWGMTIWLVATRLAEREPGLVRTLVLLPVVVWFVLDSLGSIAAGVPVNAVFNVTFLVLFMAAFRIRGAQRQPAN